MKVYKAFDEIPPSAKNVAFSLGCYDGVHKGHDHILKALKAKANAIDALSCILTFSNHPSWVLTPAHPKKLLISPSHKQVLLEKHGLDIMIEIPFSKEFASLTPRGFFSLITKHLNITSCVFGEDTCIGKDRIGTTNIIEELGKENDIEVVCLKRIEDFSSTQIRSFLEKGDLDQVKSYLGRPFSILQKPIGGKGIGKQLGYPTINLPVNKLCLPPLGVYICTCHTGNQEIPSISNLGYAPTFGESQEILLETHLLNHKLEFLPDRVEVTLHKHLRDEICFNNQQMLSDQIQKDTQAAKAYFSIPS